MLALESIWPIISKNFVFERGWSNLHNFCHLHFWMLQGNGESIVLHTQHPSHYCCIFFTCEHTLWLVLPYHISPFKWFENGVNGMCQCLFVCFSLHPLFFPRIWLSIGIFVVGAKLCLMLLPFLFVL